VVADYQNEWHQAVATKSLSAPRGGNFSGIHRTRGDAPERSKMSDICAKRSAYNAFSEAAHARVVPGKADLRFHLMEWFFMHGPATCEDAAKALDMRYTTASARISELKMDGLLEFTGDRRKTSGGSFAAVLRVRRKREPEQLRLI
jgi:hypothetical protein